MKKTYTIPSTQREKIEKTIKRLQVKANRYGQALDIRIGENHMVPQKVYSKTCDPITGAMIETYLTKRYVEAFDLTLDDETIVKKGNFSVIARIEHGEGGNIVQNFSNLSRTEWAVMPAYCAHCKRHHNQKITYIVRSDDGEEKQLGSTCLKDYTGIDVNLMGLMNQLRDLILDEDINHFDFDHNREPIVIPVDIAVCAAIDVIKTQGYVKSSERNSNKSRIDDMISINYHPSEETRKEAEEIISVVKSLSHEEAMDNLLNNVQTLATQGYCKPKHYGYIAYAPVAYSKYVEHQKKVEEIKKNIHTEQVQSNFVGEIGERITIDVQTQKLISSFDGYYGTTHVYKFVDNRGNVYIWFTAKTIPEFNKVVGTVKDHNVRDGVKQTIITRCKGE